jgi:protein tyrosine phosphatase (PTP) superfamily phosphohydrolase (DUF442 family)
MDTARFITNESASDSKKKRIRFQQEAHLDAISEHSTPLSLHCESTGRRSRSYRIRHHHHGPKKSEAEKNVVGLPK